VCAGARPGSSLPARSIHNREVLDPTALRTAVTESVAARRPVDGREREAQATCLGWLADLPAPFDQDASPVHVTGSGIIAGPQGVLLLEHRRLHIWVQPGGHLEVGETPWAAALRESTEETGLRLALLGPDSTAPPDRPVGAGGTVPDPAAGGPPLVHVDVHPSAGGHTHLDLRYALGVEGDPRPRPPAGESQAVQWYGWADAIAIADPGLAGLLRHLAPAEAR
jgi:8-oxo-dGTP pyrophosphatase MutT (NUDIX family)